MKFAIASLQVNIVSVKPMDLIDFESRRELEEVAIVSGSEYWKVLRGTHHMFHN